MLSEKNAKLQERADELRRLISHNSSELSLQLQLIRHQEEHISLLNTSSDSKDVCKRMETTWARQEEEYV